MTNWGLNDARQKSSICKIEAKAAGNGQFADTQLPLLLK